VIGGHKPSEGIRDEHGDHRARATGYALLSAAAWPGTASPVVRRPRERAWIPLALVTSALLALTLAVPTVPGLQFAYRTAGLHVTVETGIALIALLGTAIVVRHAGLRLDRLTEAAGLMVIATTGAALSVMLAVAPDSGPRLLIAIGGTLVGAALLAAGAFTPARRIERPLPAALAMAAITVPALAAVAVPIDLALGEEASRVPVDDLSRPQPGGPAAILSLQLAIAGAFVVAAVGLTWRGIHAADAFARRLGPAVMFLAFAKLHYVLLPPQGSELLHIGDVLRLLFCVVLLWAAVCEVAGLVERRAAERERKRIARDLHDGVAQELAFIHRRAARLTGQPDVAEIAVAAERALLDSRWALERLARPPDEPLDRVLARHAAVIAARTGVAVTFASSGAVEAGPEVREALVRILGEAVANARHGQATRVHVELSSTPLRLRVVDDGVGFDAATPGTGFGLGGMRERAALVGAQLSVRSDPGAGTEVAVELR
jgi:signal transduction histidine kinase